MADRMDVWRRREYAVAHNWSAFVEYNYLDFGTKAANSTHLLSLPNYDRGPGTST